MATIDDTFRALQKCTYNELEAKLAFEEQDHRKVTEDRMQAELELLRRKTIQDNHWTLEEYEAACKEHFGLILKALIKK